MIILSENRDITRITEDGWEKFGKFPLYFKGILRFVDKPKIYDKSNIYKMYDNLLQLSEKIETYSGLKQNQKPDK